MHEAICRALEQGIKESREAYSLIEANLTYAISGEEASYDIFSLEQHIAQKQSEASDLVKLSLKTGANAEKFEAEISKLYCEIKTLREQLKQTRDIMQKTARANDDVTRISAWLSNQDVAFEEYDDVVVRRLVDTIKVNSDNTITVILKGGIEISERIHS